MRSQQRRHTQVGVLVLLVSAVGGAAVSPAVARAEPAPVSAAVAALRASVDPASGPIGSAVVVRASGFAPGETISILFEDSFSSARATEDGRIAARISVPLDAAPGTHQVYLTGNQSRRSATVPFVVRENWTQAGSGAEHDNLLPRDAGLLTAADVGGLRQSWEVGVGNAGAAGAAVVSDGTVYVGTPGGKVVALEQRTGVVRWSATAGSAVVGSPAVVDGNVVVALRNGTVLALGIATGGEAWRFASGSTSRAGLSVDGSSVYAGFADGRLVALDVHFGTTTWSAAGTGAVTTIPTVASGVVVVARSTQLAGYVSTTGAARWTSPLASAATGTPSYSSAAGTLLVTTARSGLYGIDARSGRSSWQVPGLTAAFSPTTQYGAAWVMRQAGNAWEIVIVDPATGRLAESVGTVPTLPTSGLTRVGDLLVFTGTDRAVYATRAFADSTPMVQFRAAVGSSDVPVAVVDGTLVFGTTTGTVARYTLG